jgi:hypothetical protein
MHDMSAPGKQKKIQELIAGARESLRLKSWFEAERIAIKAMMMSRQEQDFLQMADVVPLLQEARGRRVHAATTKKKITVIEAAFSEDVKIRAGCYVIQPPLVGADARRFRLIALGNEIPMLVVCREPMTRTRLTPVVAISPGCTLRARVAPPEKPEAPELAWIINAIQAIGDQALQTMDMTLPLIRRIDLLIEYLDALPEHEDLHHALESACRQMHEESLLEQSKGAGKSAKSKSA